MNDEKFVSFITTRWVGVDENAALAWVDAEGQLPDLLRETHMTLSQEPGIQEPLREYLTTRKRLHEAVDSLRRLVGIAPS